MTTEDRSTGERAMAWVWAHSPILTAYREHYGETKPFEGLTAAVSAPLTPHTGVFVETLRAAGASVCCCGEPGTDDAEVIAELATREGIEPFAEAGMAPEGYEAAREAVLEREPDLVFDDGCVLVSRLHERFPSIAEGVLGGAEQTTAGVTRLEAMEREGVLRFPVVRVNDTPMKRAIDNAHGTPESTISALTATTGTAIAGTTFVIAGYGDCGRGLATKLDGMGAHTIITETDPRKALQAHLDGHGVTSMAEAAPLGECVLSATGSKNVLRTEHFEAMGDKTLLATVGSENEIDTEALAALATERSEPKAGITRYHLPDGRRLDLLSRGAVFNLAAPGASGNPVEIMDLTFAAMFLAGREHLRGKRSPGLYTFPDRLDRALADRTLESLDISHDRPTTEQETYTAEWRRGR